MLTKKNSIFTALLDEAQSWAKSAGYKPKDIEQIIKSVRERKRKKHEHSA